MIWLFCFYYNSLTTAKLARSLAGLGHHNQIAAYTAGLLHALGELQMHLAAPQAMAPINALVSPLDLRRSKIEQHLLGYCYGQVSAGLALVKARVTAAQVKVPALPTSSEEPVEPVEPVAPAPGATPEQLP